MTVRDATGIKKKSAGEDSVFSPDAFMKSLFCSQLQREEIR